MVKSVVMDTKALLLLTAIVPVHSTLMQTQPGLENVETLSERKNVRKTEGERQNHRRRWWKQRTAKKAGE